MNKKSIEIHQKTPKSQILHPQITKKPTPTPQNHLTKHSSPTLPKKPTTHHALSKTLKTPNPKQETPKTNSIPKNSKKSHSNPQTPDKKTTKKHLKTLLKSGRPHPVRAATRVTKYGTVGFARNIWLSIASAFVIIITLVVLFATLISNFILISITNTMRDKIDITVYTKPETSKATLQQLATTLKTDPNVRLVQTANSEQELEKFIQERQNNPEILNAINTEDMREILLKSMNSTLTIKIKNIDDISSVKNIIENHPLFTEHLATDRPPSYDAKRAVIERIKNWANIAKTTGIILSSVFLFISVIMIYNTIRIAIFSRREEIYMMKLIGASPSFIKGPFLVEAELSGIISGLIAALISTSALKFLLPYLHKAEIDTSLLTQIHTPHWLIITFALMVILGTLIGSIAARLAMLKYIKRR